MIDHLLNHLLCVLLLHAANYRCNAEYQLFKQHVEEVKQKMGQEKIDTQAAEAVAAAQAAKKSRGWWSRGAA